MRHPSLKSTLNSSLQKQPPLARIEAEMCVNSLV